MTSSARVNQSVASRVGGWPVRHPILRVEVAELPSAVAIRDSKDPDGPVLVFAVGPWAAFVAGTRRDALGSSH